MEYAVLVEQKNDIWRAFIPTLSDLSAEGFSYEEAVQKVQQAAETYLASIKMTTINLHHPVPQFRRGSKQAVLNAAGKFKGDETAMIQHIEEIYAERRKQH